MYPPHSYGIAIFVDGLHVSAKVFSAWESVSQLFTTEKKRKKERERERYLLWLVLRIFRHGLGEPYCQTAKLW